MDTTEKFATKINKRVLTRLRGYAKRNNQTISLVVSEAVAQYLDRAEVRQPFRDAAKEILETHSELLKELAK